MASLSWVRLDCAFPRNHKVLALLLERGGDRAVLRYTFALTYCGEQGTDGFIPRECLPMIHSNKRDMAALVAAGMLVEIAGGWQIPDWAEYQPTSAETAARSERAKAAAAKRWSNRESLKAMTKPTNGATVSPIRDAEGMS